MTTMTRSSLTRWAHTVLLGLMRAVLRQPRLKRAARHVLLHVPALQARLQRFSRRAALAPDALRARRPHAVHGMSPRSARRYAELQRSISARKP
jgi:hypothetical protein